jgi:phosphate transport system substrate-binding protein
MKKIFTVILAAVLAGALFVSCSSSPATSTLSGTVKTGGSTSVEKVMNALIYQFQGDNTGVQINYEMNGSGDGIKNTASGQYEIGHSSRELKQAEIDQGLVGKPYAIDGIAIVVNKANTATNLTKDQIFKIYTGKITNWKDVGGADAAITVVTREVGSGTRTAVADLVGLEVTGKDDTKVISSATVCNDTGSVQTTVTTNKNAIGYMSFSDLDATKVTALQYNGVAISEATMTDGTYGLKRNFWLITKKDATLSAPAQAFYDFILGPAGQAIVKSNGLLTITQ